eukprot:13293943-Alexandrium_andersonii.AAC.1
MSPWLESTGQLHQPNLSVESVESSGLSPGSPRPQHHALEQRLLPMLQATQRPCVAPAAEGTGFDPCGASLGTSHLQWEPLGPTPPPVEKLSCTCFLAGSDGVGVADFFSDCPGFEGGAFAGGG